MRTLQALTSTCARSVHRNIASPRTLTCRGAGIVVAGNKENLGRTEYLGKRNEILRHNVHLVEFDLLRGGQRVPSPKPLPSADCYYLVAHAEKRFDCAVYHWKLADALPRLPVPLRPPDADVIVDLAQVFTTAYERGRFGRRLRYDQPCPSPLTDEERAWAEQVIVKVMSK